MTTAPNRPSLTPKVTRGTENKRADVLNFGIAMTLPIEDGVEEFSLRLGDLTSPIARELRANYGGSFEMLVSELLAVPGIDTIATFVWLVRRTRGENVQLDDVLVSYEQMFSDDFQVTSTGAEELNGSPEA